MSSVSTSIAAWQAAREALETAERDENPDVVDAHGQRWTWWKGSLYRSGKGNALPLCFIDVVT